MELQVPLQIQPNQPLPPSEVVYFYSAPPVWFFSALDKQSGLDVKDLLNPEQRPEKTRSHNGNQNPPPCLLQERYIRFDWTKVVEWLTDEVMVGGGKFEAHVETFQSFKARIPDNIVPIRRRFPRLGSENLTVTTVTTDARLTFILLSEMV